jgi:catechol 2,3-dioxygenase-like lactoylglutathione lyase family enzyme
MILKQIAPRLQELLALPAPDQIGMVVQSIEKSIDAYSTLLSWGPFEVFQHKYTELIYRGKPGSFRYRVALGQISPTLQLEFIENIEGESIYTEFLRARGEGVHHFGFTVQGMDKRIEAMKELGIGVLQSGRRPGRNFAYMDTEPLVGTIIEFREQAA